MNSIGFKTTERGARWIRGELVGLDAESLRVVPQGRADTVVALRQVSRLDVSLGRRSNAGNGALVGGGIAGGVGLTIGLLLAGACAGSSSFCGGSDDEISYVLFPTALLTGVGVGLGALIGATSSSERWAEVRRPWTTTDR